MVHGLETIERLNNAVKTCDQFAEKVERGRKKIVELGLADSEIIALSIYGQVDLVSLHLEWDAFKRVRPRVNTCSPMESVEGQYHHEFVSDGVTFRAFTQEVPV